MLRLLVAILSTLILITGCAGAIGTTPNGAPVSFEGSDGSLVNGTLYGKGSLAVILSNMDPNIPSSWNPLLPNLLSHGYMVLTYSYQREDIARLEDLKDALAFVRSQGARKIVLIGASRGGVISLQIAGDPQQNFDLAGVAVLSAPQHFEGTTFFSDQQISRIKISKLLINSVDDDWADQTRAMFDIMQDPKAIYLYPGDAHGSNIFHRYRQDLTQRLLAFVDASLKP